MKSTKAAIKSSPTEPKPGKAAAQAAREGMAERPATRTLLKAGGVVAVISVVVFINCLANGWVFDDYLHVLDPPDLRSLSNVFTLLGHYRPLRDISYAFDFWLWGESTVGFHFTNVALHSVNALLVFVLCYRLLKDVPAAVLAALIFALHPIQTDSVAYVSGRRDILFSLFYLLAFHFYLAYRKRRSGKMLCLTMGCWVLSLMSKEMAASFPVFVFLWNYTGEWDQATGSWARRFFESARTVLKRERLLYLGMTVVVLAYSYYDIVLERATGRAGTGGLKYWGGSVYSNVLTELRVQAWFLKQLVYPTPIGQYLGAFPISTTIFDWKVILAAVVVLATLGAGLYSLGKWRMLSFAILSYFAILLPVSQIIPHHELLADHYLYLPIFSFALAISFGTRALARMSDRRRVAAYAAAGCALLIFAILTVRQNAVWKDDRTFWAANYAKVPDSPRAVFSYAGQYVSLNPRRAMEMYRRCVTLDPTYGPAYIFLARMVNNKDDARDVEGLIQSGLDIPDDQVQPGRSVTGAQFRSQLDTAQAILKGATGDQAAAESLLLDAASLDPSSPQPYQMLADIYAKDKDKLMALFQRELSAIPDSIPARDGIIILLIKDQKFDDAIPYLDAILRINSNDVFANYQMGQIFRVKKDCARARPYLKRAAAEARRPSDVTDVKNAMKEFVKDCGNQ